MGERTPQGALGTVARMEADFEYLLDMLVAEDGDSTAIEAAGRLGALATRISMATGTTGDLPAGTDE